MTRKRSRRSAAKHVKEPIRYDPADLSNVVDCLSEIKNIMLMLVAEIERIEYTPPVEITSIEEEKPQEDIQEDQ